MDAAPGSVTDPSPQNPVEEAMVRAGDRLVEKVQDDYFSFDETWQVPLPDGISYVEHHALTEGAKKTYQNSINRAITMRKGTGDAEISTAPGDERHALLKAAICGWNLLRDGAPVSFNEQNLKKFLESANPKIIDLIEKDVRLKNPWLLQEMTVEDIDREIEALQEMRAKKVEEEEGKAAS